MKAVVSHLLLGFLCVQLVSAVFQARLESTSWLEYACKTDGTIEAVNPNPSVYRYGYASRHYNESKSEICDVQFAPDRETLLITGCLSNHTAVELILSDKPIVPLLVANAQSETFTAHCNFHFGWYTLVRVDVSTEPSWNSTDNSVPEPGNITVDYKLKTLSGAEGYTAFTVGYPIGLELIGPPGLRILPRQCRLSPSTIKEDFYVQQVVARFGCSVSMDTFFDFSEEGVDYEVLDSRSRETQDPALQLLKERMMERNIDIKGRSLDASISEARHSLISTLFGLRYANTKAINLHCKMDVCPVGDPLCNFDCATWRARKLFARQMLIQGRALPEELAKKRRPNWNMRKEFREQALRESRNPKRTSHIKERRNIARAINRETMSGFSFNIGEDEVVNISSNGSFFVVGQKVMMRAENGSGESLVLTQTILERIQSKKLDRVTKQDFPDHKGAGLALLPRRTPKPTASSKPTEPPTSTSPTESNDQSGPTLPSGLQNLG